MNKKEKKELKEKISKLETAADQNKGTQASLLLRMIAFTFRKKIKENK